MMEKSVGDLMIHTKRLSTEGLRTGKAIASLGNSSTSTFVANFSIGTGHLNSHLTQLKHSVSNPQLPFATCWVAYSLESRS